MHILTELAQHMTNGYIQCNKNTSRTIVAVKDHKCPNCVM